MKKMVDKKKKLTQKMKMLEISSNSNVSNCTFKVDEMTSRDFHNDVHAHVEVITQLLSDKHYWNIYKNFIFCNKHLFRGRTVLNIGCCVGLLSLFAAKAGAAQVFAVDESNVTDYAYRVVQQNNYGHIIKVIKSKLQHLELPVAEVDIILCDWMGYSLLFQSRCSDVIYARDKWLKRDTGIILPDMAKLYIAGLTDLRHKYERVDWWDCVYGFNMKALRNFALKEPCFQQVQQHQILSTPTLVYNLDLNTASLEDLKFRKPLLLKVINNGSLDGVFTYFIVNFSKSHTPVIISSEPAAPCTRWLQAVYYFDQSLHVKINSKYYCGFELQAINKDLTHMMARFEMLSGDTVSGLQLELDMCWHLKPASMCKSNEVKVESYKEHEEEMMKRHSINNLYVNDNTKLKEMLKENENEQLKLNKVEKQSSSSLKKSTKIYNKQKKKSKYIIMNK